MNRTYQFDPDVACALGVNAAILLYYIDWWITKNKVEGRNFYEGRYWTYNSAKAFAELFPFWSEDLIQKLLVKLEKTGIIISGNFNEDKRDRTKWYTIDYEAACFPLKERASSRKIAECTPIINNTYIRTTYNNPPISPQGEEGADAELFSDEIPADVIEAGNISTPSPTKNKSKSKYKGEGFHFKQIPADPDEVKRFIGKYAPSLDWQEFFMQCERSGWRYGKNNNRPIKDWKAEIFAWVRYRAKKQEK